MKAIRKLINYFTFEKTIKDHPLDILVREALVELEAIETTFAEIAKLQQRILGDSKPIGGTAYNKQSTKCVHVDGHSFTQRHCVRCGYVPE